MSSQIQITGETKVKSLTGVLVGTSGVVSSLNIDGSLGIPQLDVNGKIIVSQLPNSVMEYKGTWDASTNTPTLANGTGNQGDVYLCSVAGTVNFGAGPISFVVSDQVIYSGSIWQKASGSNGTVTSIGLSSTGNDAITITGSPVTTSGTINLGFAGTNLQYINGAGDLTTFPTLISSIGLSMPSAFSVSNSPLTANGTIAVTGAGYPSQYIRGDGTLADFPTSGGGGSSVSYYLNGGTSQGTIGGVTYYEMSKTADTGTGVDFSLVGNGLIVSFLTDAGDPAQLNIPAGNWNYEIYASMSSNGGTPQMYAELYVYNGTTFTLISTSSNEILYDGVNLNLYTFAMTVPATTLTLTDRLAVKLYATNSGGKTTTVHTQDSHLCQIITTFSTGITALNGLTAQVQYFATGTSGTDFNISSTTATHTFNIPSASATNRGLITTGTQTIAGDKTFQGETTSITSSYFNLDGIGGSVGNMLNIKQYSSNTTRGVGYSSIGAIDKTKFIFYLGNTTAFNSRQFYLDGVNLTVNTPRTYTLPDASGTLALTSNLSSYVPYTGATATVNLGTNALSAGAITSEAGYAFKILSAGTLFQNGYSVISSLTGNISFTQAISAGLLKAFSFDISAWANNSSYTYILPAANGTLALTSDLGSYLPLSGGTLTGTLNSNSLIYTSLNFKTDSSVAFKNITSGGTAPSALTGYSQLFFDTYQLSIRKADNQSINIRYPNSALTQTWDFNVEGFIAVQYNASQTTGGVSFVRSTGQFTQDATKFFWDDTNKRLGIGNATPSYPLDVTGIIKGSTSIYATNDLYIGDTTGSATGRLIITDSSNQGVNIRRNNAVSERFKLFVGNGTTYTQDNCIILGTNTDIDFYTGSSPIKRLTIQNAGGLMIPSDVSGTSGYRINYTSADAGSRSWKIGNDNSAYGDFFIAQSTTQSGSSYATKFCISPGNDVGIGTGSPTERLDINHSSSTACFIRLRNTAGSGVYVGNRDNNLELWSGGTKNMTITSGGDITTTGKISNSSQTYNLAFTNSSGGGSQVLSTMANAGGSLIYGLEGNTAGATFTNSTIYSVVIGTPTSTGRSFHLATDGVVRMTIASGGAVTVVGALSKGSGSFRIDHPLESMTETHQLVHSFIEGPKADLIYRGRLNLVNGKGQANIDEVSTMTDGTFEVLCREVQCFTTNESGWDLIKGKVIGNIIYIESQNPNSTDEISWMVIGERKDKHMMDTEWTDDNGRVIVEPLKRIEPSKPTKPIIN